MEVKWLSPGPPQFQWQKSKACSERSGSTLTSAELLDPLKRKKLGYHARPLGFFEALLANSKGSECRAVHLFSDLSRSIHGGKPTDGAGVDLAKSTEVGKEWTS